MIDIALTVLSESLSNVTRPATCSGLADSDFRLITYGGLSPGGNVHYQIERLSGVWEQGFLVGRLSESWIGFPSLVLDPAGVTVPVHIFSSPDLPTFWPVLDAYEAYGYRRVIATAETEDGPLQGCIYVECRR